MSVLSADSLRVRSADGVELLTDISLEISEGESVLLCGPPGSGKTLLVKMIRGLLDDRRDLMVSGRVNREGSIGFMFQRPSIQIVRRVVRHDVAFGLENRGLPVDEIETRMAEYSRLLNAEYLLDREVEDLSGGETAIVALLGILVTEPDVLILDEPVSSLDYQNTLLVLEAIDSLRKNETAVVIAEHDVRDLLVRADQLLLLSDGRVENRGAPRDLLDQLRASDIKLPFSTQVGLALRDVGHDTEIPLAENSIEGGGP